jgi:DNA-binding FadR family transcriptional regulator
VARRSFLTDRLYEEILDGIVNGKYPRNARLPTEAEFSRDFSVSRTVVRDALARLRNDGLISSRQGAGSFVTAKPDEPAELFAPVTSLGDLERCFECRAAIESEIAYYAAKRGKAADIGKLREVENAFETAVKSGRTAASEDLKFHITLADAADNHLFKSIVLSIRPHILFGMNLSKTLSKTFSDHHLARVLEEHAVILEAVAKGDADAAREAMRAHVENAKQRIFKGRN